jgi:hypothetical protein
MGKIDISLRVWKYLESQRESVNESHNDILLRLFNLDSEDNIADTSVKRDYDNDGFNYKDNSSLPEGLKLFKMHQGIEYHAIVKNGQIVIDNIDKVFDSPSSAAVFITGYSTNGWIWWKYFDEKKQDYSILDDLR